MLYSCKQKEETNQKQLALVKKDCQNKEACQIKASREFFGNSECPGTEDAEMALWLIYSCDGGGSDKTTSHNGTCSTGSCNELEQGEVKQVEVAGCGGWVKLDCDGGCINILKVLNSPSLCAKHAGPKGPNAESAGAVTGIRCLPIGWDGGHSWTVFSGQNQDFMGPKNIHT